MEGLISSLRYVSDSTQPWKMLWRKYRVFFVFSPTELFIWLRTGQREINLTEKRNESITNRLRRGRSFSNESVGGWVELARGSHPVANITPVFTCQLPRTNPLHLHPLFRESGRNIFYFRSNFQPSLFILCSLVLFFHKC